MNNTPTLILQIVTIVVIVGIAAITLATSNNTVQVLTQQTTLNNAVTTAITKIESTRDTDHMEQPENQLPEVMDSPLYEFVAAEATDAFDISGVAEVEAVVEIKEIPLTLSPEPTQPCYVLRVTKAPTSFDNYFSQDSDRTYGLGPVADTTNIPELATWNYLEAPLEANTRVRALIQTGINFESSPDECGGPATYDVLSVVPAI